MAISYSEKLPDELAKIMMAEAYDPKLWYQLITDIDGSYITAYDKETGEHVSITTNPDGIPDDYKLDVEEFAYLDEELKAEEDALDYSTHAFRWISVVVIVSCVIAVVAVGIMCKTLLIGR